MKNILVVVAHPGQKSLNFSIAHVIKEQKELQGNQVKLLDLYADHQQDFLRFEYPNNTKAVKVDDNTAYHQKLISWADHIIFVFPYWWGGEPAILKNWLDTNFLTDFAFQRINNRPKGLLDGKSVTIFTTTATPTFLYILLECCVLKE